MISWIKHEYISSSEDEINIRLTDLVATKRTLVTIKGIYFNDIDYNIHCMVERSLEKNESLCIRGLNHSEIIVLNDYPSKYYYNTDYNNTVIPYDNIIHKVPTEKRLQLMGKEYSVKVEYNEKDCFQSETNVQIIN